MNSTFKYHTFLILFSRFLDEYMNTTFNQSPKLWRKTIKIYTLHSFQTIRMVNASTRHPNHNVILPAHFGHINRAMSSCLRTLDTPNLQHFPYISDEKSAVAGCRIDFGAILESFWSNFGPTCHCILPAHFGNP